METFNWLAPTTMWIKRHRTKSVCVVRLIAFSTLIMAPHMDRSLTQKP